MATIHRIENGETYVPTSNSLKEAADHLRELADEIERGEWGNVLHAGVLLDDGRRLRTSHTMTRVTNNLDWLGILAHATWELNLTISHEAREKGDPDEAG